MIYSDKKQLPKGEQNANLRCLRLCSAAMLLLILLLTLPAAAEDFVEGAVHENTPEFYRYFKCSRRSSADCSVWVEQRIFDNAAAEAWWLRISGDAAAIQVALGQDCRPCDIYIVAELVNGGMQRIGNRVYCTPAEVETGAFHPLMIQAMTSCDSWKAIGLSGILFGETAVEDLAGYYQDAADLDMLSLSPVYFMDRCATVEEIRMARATATALSSYLISRDGTADFLAVAYGDDARTAWLNAIGVNRTFVDRYGDVESSYDIMPHAYYALQARSRDFCVTFYVVAGIRYSSDTPVHIRRFLHEAHAGTRAILETVRAEAPAYYGRISDRILPPETAGVLAEASRLQVYLDGKRPTSLYSHRQIFLLVGTSYLHELMHHLLAVENPPANYPAWAHEGMAELALLRFYATESWPEQLEDSFHAAQQWLAQGNQPATPEEKLICDVAEYVLSYASESFSAYEYEAYVAFYELQTCLGQTMHDTYSGIPANAAGAELTYSQAAMFVDYLADRFSLSACLDFLLDSPGDFEAAFGLTYAEARDDWKAALMLRYK